MKTIILAVSVLISMSIFADTLEIKGEFKELGSKADFTLQIPDGAKTCFVQTVESNVDKSTLSISCGGIILKRFTYDKIDLEQGDRAFGMSVVESLAQKGFRPTCRVQASILEAKVIITNQCTFVKD
ncbi:MAG: hypothetical protein ISR65_14550 [Bacteriovoracaceae bacterium]|nr:hypothetical protein [Bacteriovoracaceae bacterium]